MGDMGRMRAIRGSGALGLPVAVAVAVAVSGCTVATDPVPTSPTTRTNAPIPSASTAPVSSAVSEFEQQLPLTGLFVSQATETSGTARIERRADGSVWVILEDFDTGEGSDLRLYLKEDPLLQDAEGHWGSAEDGYEIASIDPMAPTQEIEVRGASDMPAIRTLTVLNYVAPDFPAFGSAALG
ncbi:hypothetical protein LQ757_17860 [Agromyces sp. SYSU K20354]|uniref:hypothetical protein n=1 Tax=Agromyces cavernae TaxID=2898659 RepID=UPI001E4F2C31|nr:hypothetical protein [Agromyces cavernae]MCD2444154.1 hypothetical protein [Agromyces cavernae]